MCKANHFVDHVEFSQRYLKPLLIDPLQARLESLPDFRQSLHECAELDPDGGMDEKSGGGAVAAFTGSDQGWTYRDHVLLKWQKRGEFSHQRESEQDLQYSVVISRQPDMAGEPRLTVDLHASLMRYERDAVSQHDGDRVVCDLGKGWARVTLQWSLRLQLVVTADGRANVISRVKNAAPVTDTGRIGAYIASDPLARLLNMQRIAHAWEHGAAGLAAVQDQLVSRLAAAIEPVLGDDEHV